jgi:hypothetical protein
MVAAAEGTSTASGILRATASFTGNAEGFAVVSAVGKNVGWTPEPVDPDIWTPQEVAADTWTPQSTTSSSWTEETTGSSDWTPQSTQSSNWQRAA